MSIISNSFSSYIFGAFSLFYQLYYDNDNGLDNTTINSIGDGNESENTTIKGNGKIKSWAIRTRKLSKPKGDGARGKKEEGIEGIHGASKTKHRKNQIGQTPHTAKRGAKKK